MSVVKKIATLMFIKGADMKTKAVIYYRIWKRYKQQYEESSISVDAAIINQLSADSCDGGRLEVMQVEIDNLQSMLSKLVDVLIQSCVFSTEQLNLLFSNSSGLSEYGEEIEVDGWKVVENETNH